MTPPFDRPFSSNEIVSCPIYDNDTMTLPQTGGQKVAEGTSRRKTVAILVGVAAVTGCCIVGGTALALIFPALSNLRGKAARTESTNNLRQIGMAYQAYFDVHKRAPFNGADANGPILIYKKNAEEGNPFSGSWAYQILPFIEEPDAREQPRMRFNREKVVSAFLCPGRRRPFLETSHGGGAWTDYFYNNYLNDAGNAERPDSLPRGGGAPDGTANTVFVGHGNISTTQYSLDADVTLSTNIYVGGTLGTMRAGKNGKRSPAGVSLNRDSAMPPTIGSWGGPFSQGALMVMCDGHVVLFPYSTPNFGDFLTPAGGEARYLPE
jgi:type II secretory pathway pseudopilin PulG